MQDAHPFHDAGGEPATMPAEPRDGQPDRDRAWTPAIIVSGLLHAGVAAAFLIAPAGTFVSGETVQEEGADHPGADIIGSALNDALPGAVDVTLVPDTRPPKPPSAQPAPAPRASRPPARMAMREPSPGAIEEPVNAPDILAAKAPSPDGVGPTSEAPAPAPQPQRAEVSATEAAPPPVPRDPAGPAGSRPAMESRGAMDNNAAEAPVLAGKGRKHAATGNAMEARYSGEVQKKLARANRHVSKSVQEKARTNARVVFVVMADGSIGDLRLAESSGSAELDQFALALVRRQAPFPPIPPETGRSSWVFKARIGPY